MAVHNLVQEVECHKGLLDLLTILMIILMVSLSKIAWLQIYCLMIWHTYLPQHPLELDNKRLEIWINISQWWPDRVLVLELLISIKQATLSEEQLHANRAFWAMLRLVICKIDKLLVFKLDEIKSLLKSKKNSISMQCKEATRKTSCISNKDIMTCSRIHRHRIQAEEKL